MKTPGRCHKCIRRAKHKLVDKWYCPKCFIGLVEQKIRHNLRRYGLRKGSRLLVTDNASEYVARKVVNIPVGIIKGKRQADYLVLPWTMDDENEEFIKTLLQNKRIVAKENRKIIKLFYLLSKKDMKAYFAIKKVSYRPVKTEMNSLLDRIEEKHPGTKSALLKSEERLRQVI